MLEKAVNEAFPYSVRDQGLKLVQDNGSQFTSRDFVSTLKILGIEHSNVIQASTKQRKDGAVVSHIKKRRGLGKQIP